MPKCWFVFQLGLHNVEAETVTLIMRSCTCERTPILYAFNCNLQDLTEVGELDPSDKITKKVDSESGLEIELKYHPEGVRSPYCADFLGNGRKRMKTSREDKSLHC
jgi:hypothetical protein